MPGPFAGQWAGIRDVERIDLAAQWFADVALFASFKFFNSCPIGKPIVPSHGPRFLKGMCTPHMLSD